MKNVYPGITVEKYECVGYYQKRVGNRLRKRIRWQKIRRFLKKIVRGRFKDEKSIDR